MNEHEVWQVQLRTGEVRRMSLDALDEAFEAGIIDAQTPVLAPGAIAWQRLGAVAGLDDAPPSQLEVPTPSLSPVALAPMPPSTAAQLDLDLDVPDDALKPKRGRVFAIVGGAAAVLLLGGAGLVAKLGGHAEAPLMKIEATTAVQAPPAAVEEPAPPPVETRRELTEEQKKKLAEADKAREEKARSAKEKAAQKAQKRRGVPRTKGTGLLKGGSSFDPLNGSL